MPLKAAFMIILSHYGLNSIQIKEITKKLLYEVKIRFRK